MPPSLRYELADAVLREHKFRMKLVVEIVVSAILHPLAVVLLWLNLAARTDLGGSKKLIWAIVGLVWGIGPILYVTIGDGALW